MRFHGLARVARLPLLIFGWSLVVILLWWTIERLLDSQRGLDLGDEGLYLLAAAPPSPTAAYVFPFGWHTQPLFQLVEYDVGAFRTLGGVLLSLAGMWVGLGAAQLIRRSVGGPDTVVQIFACLAGMGAAWFYYFTLLRAPSYNWVTLMGLCIAVGAALRQWAYEIERLDPNQRPHGQRGPRIELIALFGILGFGVTYSLVAKPTTPIFLGITYLVCSVSVVGLRRGLQAFLAVVTASISWIPVLVLVRLWPLDFVPVFIEAVGRPLVTEQQKPLQAIGKVLEIPALAYKDFRGVAATPVFFALAALLALATNAIRPWKHFRLTLIPFFAVLVLAPMFAESNLQLWQQGWERGNINVSIVLVVTSTVLIGLSAFADHGSTLPRVTRPQLLIVTLGFCLLAISLGFASTNTPYPMMKFAAPLFAAAALVPLARVPDRLVRVVVSGSLAAVAVLVGTNLLVRSQEAPYASGSLKDQTEIVTIGQFPSSLALEPWKADIIAAIRMALSQVQDRPRLLAIGPSGPGIAYSSGAQPPESLVLTWSGLPGTQALAEANLARLDREQWCNAWILLEPYMNTSESEDTLRIFAHWSQRTWPEEYERELEMGQFTLWRPRTPCPNGNSKSNLSPDEP